MVLALRFRAPLRADSNLPPSRWANRAACPTRAQEAAATALMQEIRCLVCQGQSIADSDAELAGDMRALVRAADRARRSARGGARAGWSSATARGSATARRSSR